MRCPKCHSRVLKIHVQFSGYITAFFHSSDEYQLTQPVNMISQWEEDSPCICEGCAWAGVVADAVNCCNLAARNEGDPA